MNILVTGGTGFIGTALCEYLQGNRHHLCVLTRSVERAHSKLPSQAIRLIENLEAISNDEIFDAVINLAGAPIVQRWTKQYKEELMRSRVNLTQNLVHKLKELREPPKVLISGSAIGYYGSHQDELLGEDAPANAGFSHTLCEAWENAANIASTMGTRVVNLRTGIVLGKNGGALARMNLPFKLGLGGKIGDGKQWMSWIHLKDIVRVITFCLENESIQGPLNATAPEPVTNEVFTKALGKTLRRPTLIAMPSFMIKILFGQMGEELLIEGQRVVPNKLTEANFAFYYPTINSALTQILS